jgi:hypothetical protein
MCINVYQAIATSRHLTFLNVYQVLATYVRLLAVLEDSSFILLWFQLITRKEIMQMMPINMLTFYTI